MKEALVIGMGQALRGDDVAGHLVLEALEKDRPQRTRLQKTTGGLELLDAWKEAELVIVVDAIRSGKAPGTIHLLNALEGGPEWELFGYSTHSVSLAEAIGLGQALGNLPPNLFICGIEGKSFELGGTVSSEVKAAIPRAVGKVLETLERRGYARSIAHE